MYTGRRGWTNMPSMRSASRFRTVALALTAWTLVAAVSGPPCREPASCPMDETAAAPTCDGMSSDCCQTAGERALQGPVAAPPAPVAEPAGAAAAEVAPPAPALQPNSPEHPPPRAAPGLGLYTLFAVFLI